MKITKRQLKRIIAEEKEKLVEAETFRTQAELDRRGPLKDFRVTVVVRVPERSVEYVLNSIEDGMEFDEEAGEGILSYDVQEIPHGYPGLGPGGRKR